MLFFKSALNDFSVAFAAFKTNGQIETLEQGFLSNNRFVTQPCLRLSLFFSFSEAGNEFMESTGPKLVLC